MTEGATIGGALVGVATGGILLQCVVAPSPVTGQYHIRLAVAGEWITVVLGAWIVVITLRIDETAATPFTGLDTAFVGDDRTIAGHHTRGAITGGIQRVHTTDNVGIGRCETVVTQLLTVYCAGIIVYAFDRCRLAQPRQ